MSRPARSCRLFTQDGTEVLITQVCRRCLRAMPLHDFGLRRMPDGKLRSIPWCKRCRTLPKHRRPRTLTLRLPADASTTQPHPNPEE